MDTSQFKYNLNCGNCQDNKWLNQYNLWIKTYTNLNGTPSQLSDNPEERRSANWQAYQRKQYKKRELTHERIKILEETQGWKWEEDAWDNARKEWIIQYIKLGKSPSTKSANLDEKVAGKWQSNQRHAYKNTIIIDELHANIGKWLTTDRIKILESTPGWTWCDREEDDSSDEEEEVRQDRKKMRTG